MTVQGGGSSYDTRELEPQVAHVTLDHRPPVVHTVTHAIYWQMFTGRTCHTGSSASRRPHRDTRNILTNVRLWRYQLHASVARSDMAACGRWWNIAEGVNVALWRRKCQHVQSTIVCIRLPLNVLEASTTYTNVAHNKRVRVGSVPCVSDITNASMCNPQLYVFDCCCTSLKCWRHTLMWLTISESELGQFRVSAISRMPARAVHNCTYSAAAECLWSAFDRQTDGQMLIARPCVYVRSHTVIKTV